MVFFFGDGKLGNQIFQYAFLNSFFKNKKIFSFSFIELFFLLKKIPNNFVINIKNKYLKYLSNRILNLLFIFLSSLRIISSIKPQIKKIYDMDCELRKLIRIKGFLPITFVYPYFFQSDFFYKKEIIKKFKIRNEYISKAKNYILKYTINNNSNNLEPIFVHIRRNDFKNFIIADKSNICLPFSYYLFAINWFVKNVSNPFFIFLCDDKKYVKDKFNFLKNKIVSFNNHYVDFSIISLCKYGIISNSSFSYWASSFIKEKRVIFAPKYWLGWRCKTEVHEGSLPYFARVIDPNRPYVFN
jgi:hypothetical protein